MLKKCMLAIALLSAAVAYAAGPDDLYRPYGVNNWFWDMTSIQQFKWGKIYNGRIMVCWRVMEPEKGKYVWDSDVDMAMFMHGARIANKHADKPFRYSLCIYDSPEWARADKDRILSFKAKDFAEFTVAVLKYCDAIAPGVVFAVEVENEHPTGTWLDKAPDYGTDQRDPSWYFADILRETYRAVKAYNKDILVVMDAIWSEAYHHLDELYQLGLKDFFDRINVHYYTEDYTQDNPAPNDKTRVLHFPTTMKYLKYIADSRGDGTKPVWLTEYGWRKAGEKKKAEYFTYVTDCCRKLGFVEMVYYYVGMTEQKQYEGHDPMAMIWYGTLRDPKFRRDERHHREWGAPTCYEHSATFLAHKAYAEKYPVWSMKPEPVEIIPPATKTPAIKGTDFVGKEFTAPAEKATEPFPVEPGRLYEVRAKMKVAGPVFNGIHCRPDITFLAAGQPVGGVGNYWGVVSTERYPNGIREILFPCVPNPGATEAVVKFVAEGKGTVQVLELSVKPLDLTK